MPYQAKDIHQKRERTIEFDLGDGDFLTIKWSPVNLSHDVWETAEKCFSGEIKDPFVVAEHVTVPLLTWWDIQDGDVMWPITTENVASFGLDFVAGITQAIRDDWKIGENVKKASADR